ncbi:hypothetical protein [Sphingomonas sp. PB4P5]|uniref:hypothetical protein n=1 Tax=Parasphingomonas puruogangriensis TaxID=3096155 RepID=UPI002FCBA307
MRIALIHQVRALSAIDLIGIEHINLSAARADAIVRIGALVALEAGLVPPNLRRAVRIDGGRGTMVMIVRFAEAYS